MNETCNIPHLKAHLHFHCWTWSLFRHTQYIVGAISQQAQCMKITRISYIKYFSWKSKEGMAETRENYT
jgi:hypothetical protein